MEALPSTTDIATTVQASLGEAFMWALNWDDESLSDRQSSRAQTDLLYDIWKYARQQGMEECRIEAIFLDTMRYNESTEYNDPLEAIRKEGEQNNG
jgi:hypothetical protein